MPDLTRFLRPDILGRIGRLALKTQRLAEGAISGQHRSPMHGVSPEFADHREYTPGDDLKNLDWRVYARSGRYYIKRFEEESNLRATILLDCSASMRYGGADTRTSGKEAESGKGLSKFEAGARLAAALAQVLIRQRDAVGLVTFDNDIRTTLRPAATQSQLMKIVDALEAASTGVGGETELGEVIRRTSDRIGRRGMVILISDLLADLPPLYESLGKLQHQGHDVLLLQVLHRDEVELPFGDSVIFKDIEPAGGAKPEEIYGEPWAFRKQYREAMETFIDEVRSRCRFGGIDHLLLMTDEDLGHKVSHYLHERQRRGPMKHRGNLAAQS